jgi:hypothetical protein
MSSIRNAWLAVLAAGAMVPAFANEAGYIEPAPLFGTPAGKVASLTPEQTRSLKTGAVSADGRYVYLGGEAGWAVRPHPMLVQGGSLVHGEDCVHAAAKPVVVLTGPEKALFREVQIGG